MCPLPVKYLRGVGSSTEEKFIKLGIRTAEELLDVLPRQYVDLSSCVPLEGAEDGSFCLFDALVVSKGKVIKKGKLRFFNAEVLCGEAKAKIVWFNQDYIHKILNVGEKYTFFGKVKITSYGYEFTNPHCDKPGGKLDKGAINAIYPTKGLIGQGVYRNIVAEALHFCPESVISREIEKKYRLITLQEAYTAVHKPIVKDNSSAVRRIALEKLTERIAAFRLAKKEVSSDKGREYPSDADFSPVMKNVGFALTDSQEKALEAIITSMRKKDRMNAVLCGDVGSGKTVVALLAAYFACVNGYQAAIAAPTEILAKQHYAFFGKALKGVGTSIELLTGETSAAEKKRIFKSVREGLTDILIGTHSVFSDELDFARLGLAVADEQHRFGVAQRNALIEKGKNCDVLTLSATPIPRTMCLAAYGEAEFITVERRTKGNVKTAVVPPEKRVDMWKYLAERCQSGVLAYVIAPKISDSEGIEKENCEELNKELSQYIPSERIEVLHGRMKSEEKDAVMEKFRSEEISVLIATTVVEVGVDVPKASVMIITDADRFGLATLHQLRGRIGRDGSKSYCFLCSSVPCDRLSVLVSCSDGFRIAEEDFSMRGGGEIFGLEQSGAGSLKYVNAETLKIAKQAAEQVDLKRFSERLSLLGREFSLSDVTLG